MFGAENMCEGVLNNILKLQQVRHNDRYLKQHWVTFA